MQNQEPEKLEDKSQEVKIAKNPEEDQCSVRQEESNSRVGEDDEEEDDEEKKKRDDLLKKMLEKGLKQS